MRYLAEQEDSYITGLGQEIPHNHVEETMMAARGESEPAGASAGEEGSMVSNLPLLFASGYPTSLEKITLPELERFITFMVNCSLGHDTAEVILEPQWWPKEVRFSIPLVRPKKFNESYMDNLKKLVFRCYTYHRSEYLLRFCSYLAQYPHDKLEYVDNWDSTTSLYLKTTGKLLVTFRNENMNYDKKMVNPRKKLLPVNRPNSSHTKCLRKRPNQKQAPSPAMVEQSLEDIYLCDNCDADIVGSHQMKEHEKLCYRVEQRPRTPIDLEEPPEITQNQFMDYFKMKPSGDLSDNTTQQQQEQQQQQESKNRQSSRMRSSVNLSRCPTIPFSSPAGLLLGRKSKTMTEESLQASLDKIERHAPAPALGSSKFKPKWFTKCYEFDRWGVTYRPNRDKTDEYFRRYNFYQYKEKPGVSKPALDLRAQLLYLSCKKIYAMFERLSNEQLEELKRNPSSYQVPEPKIPVLHRRSPSVVSVYEPPVPGDESNPIIVDDDDVLEYDKEPEDERQQDHRESSPEEEDVEVEMDLPPSVTLTIATPPKPPPPPLQASTVQAPSIVTPMVTTPQLPPAQLRPILGLPTISLTRTPAVAKVTPMPVTTNRPVPVRISSPVKSNLVKPSSINGKRPRSNLPNKSSQNTRQPRSIVCVDLCSSDEEMPEEEEEVEVDEGGEDVVDSNMCNSISRMDNATTKRTRVANASNLNMSDIRAYLTQNTGFSYNESSAPSSSVQPYYFTNTNNRRSVWVSSSQATGKQQLQQQQQQHGRNSGYHSNVYKSTS